MTPTRPRLTADLALFQLFRESITCWLRAAGFASDADDFDAMPAPLTNHALCALADEIGQRNDLRYKPAVSMLGLFADDADGRRVVEHARATAERTGDRALLQFVTDTYGIGSPPWWVAVTCVESIDELATRTALVTLRQEFGRKAKAPAATATLLIDGLVRFRGEANATILDRAKPSIPTAALPAA